MISDRPPIQSIRLVAPPQCQLDCFNSVSKSDVLEAIKSLPTKQCDLDPMPTWLLKANSSFIIRFLTELFNKSLLSGDVPLYLKSAYIIPRLKKSDLDDNETKNYQPISNLPVLAKLLKRIVAKQLLTLNCTIYCLGCNQRISNGSFDRNSVAQSYIRHTVSAR